MAFSSSGTSSNALGNGLFSGVSLLFAAALAVLAAKQGPSVPLAAGLGVFAVVTLMLRPGLGAILFLSVAYANVLALPEFNLGKPALLAMGASALLAVPVFVNVIVKREGFLFDRPLLLMFAFLASLLTSTFVAKDPSLSINWIVTYLTEGVLLYFLIVNAIRTLPLLRTVLWAVMIVSSALCTLSVYQEVSGDYENQFMGFAQRNTERGYDDHGGPGLAVGRERERILVAHRTAGPVGDPNRYAQILIVLLPLAVFRIWDEKTRFGKCAAFAVTCLLMGGILLSYSRGAALTLGGLTILLTVMGYFRIRHVIMGAVFLAVLVSILAPGYLGRVETMVGLDRFLSQHAHGYGEKKPADSAVRGRVTEMLAALHVFVDHPLVGVGPGQYSPHYSMEYMDDPRYALKRIGTSRRAHSLPFELAAETGILGLVIFGLIALAVARRLRDQQLRFAETRPELSRIAAGFLLGLAGYFGTAIFLHLSYQRYYWIFLGIAVAASHVLAREPDTVAGDPGSADPEDDARERPGDARAPEVRPELTAS